MATDGASTPTTAAGRRKGRGRGLHGFAAPLLRLEFLDAAQGARLERRRLARDRCFPGALHLRHPAIERLDQLEQLTNSSGGCHRHRWPPCRCGWDRETFHTSPHFVHRQYVSAFGAAAVVTAAVDRQVGQTAGGTSVDRVGVEGDSFTAPSMEVLR